MKKIKYILLAFGCFFSLAAMCSEDTPEINKDSSNSIAKKIIKYIPDVGYEYYWWREKADCSPKENTYHPGYRLLFGFHTPAKNFGVAGNFFSTHKTSNIFNEKYLKNKFKANCGKVTKKLSMLDWNVSSYQSFVVNNILMFRYLVGTECVNIKCRNIESFKEPIEKKDESSYSFYGIGPTIGLYTEINIIPSLYLIGGASRSFLVSRLQEDSVNKNILSVCDKVKIGIKLIPMSQGLPISFSFGYEFQKINKQILQHVWSRSKNFHKYLSAKRDGIFLNMSIGF